ncbi:50S ribosomal protein L28 [Ammonifex thiophilus]|uniref:Large ribosomal subunit protein bL28 n=1 Tax=Ammonifex thiophilus TaxID=444093 RepID=A0A3D8P5Y5_9THEO|nr:50S ribosomal protein L28 [Ammonifex thiophilus]RDV84724.1 50S ribosomal protein L28 [Ammonifex thiophilus]
MARRCAICGRGISFGNQRSHSNKASGRIWMPNLQRVKAIVDGQPRRIRVCTRCLKAGKVVRAL